MNGGDGDDGRNDPSKGSNIHSHRCCSPSRIHLGFHRLWKCRPDSKIDDGSNMLAYENGECDALEYMHVSDTSVYATDRQWYELVRTLASSSSESCL